MGTIAAGYWLPKHVKTNDLPVFAAAAAASKIAICTIFPVITAVFFRKACTKGENGASTRY